MMTKQTYNFVAKRIREQFPMGTDNTKEIRVMRGQLCELALSCARGFLRDNPRFDPVEFLDACSPDPQKYPISELWENEFAEIQQNGS